MIADHSDNTLHHIMGPHFFARMRADPHGSAIYQHFQGRMLNPETVPAPLRGVFLLFTNRSGSMYLGELLATSKVLNAAGEPLNRENVIARSTAQNYAYFSDYLAFINSHGTGNAIALKASLGQYDFLRRTGLLDALYPERRVVICERIDKVAQGVSWLIASKTGRWTSRSQPGVAMPEVDYDETVIFNYIRSAITAHADAELYLTLRREAFITVQYERLIEAPAEETIRILRFLGFPDARPDLTKTRLMRQESELNRAFHARFIAKFGAVLGGRVPA